jgi:predicted ATPase
VSGAIADECVRNLVAKSLVVADVHAASVCFRLLATSRAFAREQFVDTQEADLAARQHARYFRALFERAEAEWETRQTAAWLDDYVDHMPNLRAALEWAFAPGGDRALGVALAVAAVPLWFESQQVDECLQWAERALAVVEAEPFSYRRQSMHLHAALGFPIMRARFSVAKCLAAWSTTLAIAEELGDVDYQLRALWALWLARLNAAEPKAALQHAGRFCDLEAETEPAEHRIGRRMRARALHLLGRQAEALNDVTAMLADYVAPSLRSHVGRFHHDQRLCARVVQARIRWLQGHPDWALQEMEDVVAEAVSLRHTLTLIYVLAEGACPLALLAGDLAAAERFTALFEETIRAHALDAWRGYADCFRGELLSHRGEAAAGVALLRRGVESLQQSGFILLRTGFVCALAQGLAGSNRIEEAMALVGDAICQCERSGEAWCVPELRRLRGLLLFRQGDAFAAEASYRQSLREAGEQGAASWALRTETDLDRLLRARS